MTTIAWPSGFIPASLRFTQSTNNLRFTSPFYGPAESRGLAPALWMVNITMPLKQHNREFAAFLLKLRGGINDFTMYDFTRPVPVGTMRGTLTLNTSATAWDDSLSITGGAGQAGTTLKAGDWLSAGGQLFMVAADATADGSGVVSVDVEPPVRSDIASGQSVTWNKPTATYRISSTDNGFDVLNVNYIGGMTIDAMEVV
jgi:hypothetical protein